MRIPRTILKLFNQMLLLLFMYIRKIEVFIYTLFWMDTSNITFYGADSWEKEEEEKIPLEVYARSRQF